MTSAKAKIWARRIYAGSHTIEEVEERFGQEGADMVREAYLALYGVEL